MIAILDANNLAMRSYHAAKGKMSSADGVETGALHLFVRSLSMHLRHLRPDRFVACWDGGYSRHRLALYPQYKEGRRKGGGIGEPHRPTFELIAEFLRLAGLAQWRETGVEADDLIAAAVMNHMDEDTKITILSSDKDLLQLLTRDGIEQIRFSTGSALTDVWTRQRVIDDLGYPPEKVAMVMALTGDTSDSIPGVRGIGPVKAKKILDEHGWDMEKMATGDYGEEFLKWYALVTLTLGLIAAVPAVPLYDPLGTDHHNDQQWQSMTDFCARYQLRVLWDDLVSGALW